MNRNRRMQFLFSEATKKLQLTRHEYGKPAG
jgi:hypothetical protein